jgi:hypothetical protein
VFAHELQCSLGEVALEEGLIEHEAGR